MLFFGGSDDREALSLAARIGTHPKTALTVVHFRLDKAPAQPGPVPSRASFSEGSALISRRPSGTSPGESALELVEATEGETVSTGGEMANGSEAVSIEVGRLRPDREAALDEAALAFLVAEIKRDRSEGRRERAALETVEVTERSVQTAIQVRGTRGTDVAWGFSGVSFQPLLSEVKLRSAPGESRARSLRCCSKWDFSVLFISSSLK
jgi:hypothetical protein